jgi:hypothetical protein
MYPFFGVHRAVVRRATELIIPVRDELEVCRKRQEQLVLEHSAVQASEAQLRLELVRERKLAEVSSESHKLEHNSIEQRCRRLSSLLELESNARRLAEDKANRHDEVMEDNRKLVTEVSEKF